MAEKQQFKAEIKQLLQILIHSLYQDQDIFLRELVSNASDALTRLNFESLTNPDIFEPDAELAVWMETVNTDEETTLIIKDSGVGMSAEELARNLGTIAQSGAREFLAKLEAGESAPTDIIGQFGVGFYSVFMVADEVRVVSRSYRPGDEAAVWISDGGDSYQIEASDKATRGTEIHIKLKKDAADYATPHKLREVIKKHSDYVNYPIYIDGDQANQQESLWRKKAADVTDEQYHRFYQQMTFDFLEPLAHIHFQTDMPVSLRSLLFIPAKRERNMMSLRKEPGVKLYSNNVLIQEYCADLLPAWLSFVDGVVDSEDLPLNVSRETVQNNRLMRSLAQLLRKRVLRTIRKMAEKESEKFTAFWAEYGRVLKEGIAIDPAAQEEIVPLLHFVSSKSEGAITSVKQYVERMTAEQEHIYYVLADSDTAAANSPHLDPFTAKEWEVLYFTDPVDPFILATWTEFEGKKLQNVEDAEIDLPDTADDEAAPTAASEKAINLFVGRAVTALGERITEARLSKVLKGSPVRLVAPEEGGDSGMARISRMMSDNYEVPKRIFEINGSHPIIVNLAEKLEGESEGAAATADLIIEQLYESALVQEGLHPSPGDMLPRIQKLMEIASAK